MHAVLLQNLTDIIRNGKRLTQTTKLTHNQTNKIFYAGWYAPFECRILIETSLCFNSVLNLNQNNDHNDVRKQWRRILSSLWMRVNVCVRTHSQHIGWYRCRDLNACVKLKRHYGKQVWQHMQHSLTQIDLTWTSKKCIHGVWLSDIHEAGVNESCLPLIRLCLIK